MRYVKHVDTMADLIIGIDNLNRDWQRIREDALTGALLMGGFTRDVIKRTPRSEGERYRGSAKYGYSNRKDRDRYGQQRLLRSIIDGPFDLKEAHKTDFALIHKRVDSVAFAFGPRADWDVPYAIRMHESNVPDSVRSHRIAERKINPKTGRTITRITWTKGWSFDDKNYGNKYLEKPWDDNRFNVEKQMVRNIDEELKRRGLM